MPRESRPADESVRPSRGMVQDPIRGEDRSNELYGMLAALRVRFSPPAPPRDLQVTGGVLSWQPGPRLDGREVRPTHWRIYANTDLDEGLVREVPAGQTRLQDNLVASSVWVSAYSQPLDLESTRVPLGSGINPPSSGSGSARVANVVLTANTTITQSAPSFTGELLAVFVRNHATNPYRITWGSTFMQTPTQISILPSTYSVFLFVGQADGKWWLVTNFRTGVTY